MTKFRRTILACIAALVVSPVPQALATSWPIAPVYLDVNNRPTLYDPQPWLHSNGTNLWCPQTRTGSYGSSFFVQPQAWVNYGGTCNGQWGQPANWLRATASSYFANGGVIASQTIWNTTNQWSVTAAVPYNSSAGAYVASATIKDATHSYQFSQCWGTCGT